VIQPLAIIAVLVALFAYLRGLRALPAQLSWPRRRTASFVGGLVLLLAVTCGPAGHYGEHVYWLWLSQILMLLLVVPIVILCGQPVDLARLISDRSMLARAVDSGPGRAFTSPLVGPALVPLACVVVLFGSVPGWAVQYAAVNWGVQALVLLVGCAIALPLVATGDTASSLAVFAAVAIGIVELLVDAVPGLVMRLSTHPVSTFFDHRVQLTGQPGQLRDQQIAGAILWCAAELLDLPFLILIFWRWVRADAREAQLVDAALDAETSEVARLNNGQTTNEPWFLSDPRMRDRFRHQ
jgi:putative membrane protein